MFCLIFCVFGVLWFQSTWPRVLPTIFLPPLFVIDNATSEIADPSNLSDPYHYANIRVVLSMNLKIPRTMTMDFFNPEFEDKSKLLDRICSVCGVQGASAALICRHKRRAHPGVRGGAVQDIPQMSWEEMHDTLLSSAKKIMRRGTTKCLCLCNDGRYDVITSSIKNFKKFNILIESI